MFMIVGEDDDLAGFDFDRLSIRNLRCHPPFDDIVVKHEVFGAFEPRAAILQGNLRANAPRCCELGMQEDASLQPNDTQQV
jgi:hypothetical protein